MKTFIAQMETPEGQRHSERIKSQNKELAENEARNMFEDSRILSVQEGYRYPRPKHHFKVV